MLLPNDYELCSKFESFDRSATFKSYDNRSFKCTDTIPRGISNALSFPKVDESSLSRCLMPQSNAYLTGAAIHGSDNRSGISGERRRDKGFI